MRNNGLIYQNIGFLLALYVSVSSVFAIAALRTLFQDRWFAK